jgi:type I restriction enzyme S subunit
MSIEDLDETLPAGWTNSSIGNVAEFVRGVTYQKSDARTQMEDGYIPLIRATNISHESITYDEFVYVPRNLVKSEQLIRMNDMVIAASSGSISVVGKSAPVLTNYEATFGAFCAVLRPVSGVLPGYFRLFVQSPVVRETWSNLARGTNINNLKREQVLSTSFPLAPIAEQEKIVEILDEQLSRLDAALASVRAVQEKSVRFRRSLLHSMLAQPVGERSIDDEGEWETARLGSIVDFLNGYAFKSEWYEEDGVRLVRGQNIAHGYLDWTDTRCLSPNKASEFSRFSLEEGDILVSLDRPIISTGLKWAVVKKSDLPALLLQRVSVLRPKENVLDPGFLRLWVQSPHLVEMINPGRSIGVPHISTKELAELTIAFPSIEKQICLARQVEEQLMRLDASLASAEVIEKNALALRRSLLHSAFSGELTKLWREGTHV